MHDHARICVYGVLTTRFEREGDAGYVYGSEQAHDASARRRLDGMLECVESHARGNKRVTDALMHELARALPSLKDEARGVVQFAAGSGVDSEVAPEGTTPAWPGLDAYKLLPELEKTQWYIATG